jgi:geranylgeranyl pyrophosphate synthase
LATVQLDPQPVDAPAAKKRRRSTSHLKVVPETRALREELRVHCRTVAAGLDKSRPLTKDEMEALARELLSRHGQHEGFVGWTMVMLASAFYHDQVAAVPYDRRLFLLPHCLKHAEGCPADYDEFGLDCRKCGACSIADFRSTAEDLGYKVLVAEGSPIVLKIIVSGHVDAIVGVACLNVLEKAIDKILLAGIPCQAVPLLSSDCRNTSVDEDWVAEMIRVREEPPPVQTRTYVHLMRAAADMFQPAELERLAPRTRSKLALPSGGVAQRNGHVPPLDPIAGTEAIAYDFLGKGGKHSRPFITLAAHDALTGGRGTSAEGASHLAQVSDAVRRAALSIETFHKASLVHDDIEDDDRYRYGDETVHRRFGTPTAINVGDYLIGLGYRLVSREGPALGAEVVADILDRLADAHMKLCEGQGAELLWRDSRDRRLAPLDALKIYALKTAPAFEAALYSGVRLAGPVEAARREALAQFARNLGVAFQILNDLGDWEGDDHNKLSAAGDVIGGRPTVLWALALEGLAGAERQELETQAAQSPLEPAALQRIRAMYQQAGVFDKAHRLIDKYQERAESIADEIEPDELRRLLYFLVDTVLERATEDAPPVVDLTLPAGAVPTLARP